MTQRETMRHLATQEAAQTEYEDQVSSASTSDSRGQLNEIEERMKELNARQSRIETHLVQMIPSGREAEKKFATLVLAGKELSDEVAEYREGLKMEFDGHCSQVTAATDKIGQEFQYQLEMFQAFFDAVKKLTEKNQQMVEQCREMVATSSGIYNKGSAGVQEVSERTQAHLKAATETHCTAIEAQIQHFKAVQERLRQILFIGTVIILLGTFVMGLAGGIMTIRLRQLQAVEENHQVR